MNCQYCRKIITPDQEYITVKGAGSKPYYEYFFCKIQCIARYYLDRTGW